MTRKEIKLVAWSQVGDRWHVLCAKHHHWLGRDADSNLEPTAPLTWSYL